MKQPIGVVMVARLVFLLSLQLLGATSAAAQEASPTAAGSPVSLAAPGGSVEVTLTADNGAPSNGQILEGARKITLHFQSNSSESFGVNVKWVAVTAERIPADKKLADSISRLSQKGEQDASITAPDDVFPLGDYRAEIKMGNSEPQTINFKIVSPLPAAELVTRENAPHGFNLALAALGGRFESAAPEQDHERHAAVNLLDGVPYVFGGRGASIIGWTSPEAAKFPHEFVVSFNQGREATINAVIVDTRSFNIIGRENERLAPKHVQVWASTTSATDGFTKAAEARCQKTGAEQLIKLSPTKAKFVKLRILSNYGARQTQFTDLKIFEADESPSIVEDVPKNIASPALGGIDPPPPFGSDKFTLVLKKRSPFGPFADEYDTTAPGQSASIEVSVHWIAVQKIDFGWFKSRP